MTDKNTDGGPAFPVAEDHRTADQFPWTQGMSMRDWFAGQAISGVAASAKYQKADWASVYAKECYEIADAMLAARTATGGREE